MKNKGFTLVELLAVILILGVIDTITVPSVMSAIKTSREKAYERQKEMIEDAARRWSTDNPTMGETEVSISYLQEEGYLNSKSIQDPRDKKEMTGCVKIEYDKGNNQYQYVYQDCETET